MSISSPTPPVLSWMGGDPEAMLGLPAGRFTSVNTVVSLVVGCLLGVAFYAALTPFEHTHFAQMFTQRGAIPYWIVFFFGWSIAILFFKLLKLRIQARSLELTVVPPDHDFVLSSRTVDTVLGNIQRMVDDPRRFVLFNRLSISLANLRNLGRVSDLDDILRTQAEQDENMMETSYYLLQGFVWAIPVLGFIGTVLGLSDAIGGFGSVLSSTSDTSHLKDSLREVTAGLAIAFETTLEGLVAALIIQLGIVLTKKSEEEFLNACSEYCTRNVVGRIRISSVEGDA